MIEKEYFILMPAYTKILIYPVFILALIIFAYGFKKNLSENNVPFKAFFKRIYNNLTDRENHIIQNLLSLTILQKKTNKTLWGLIIHAPIFYGFITLLIGTSLIALEVDVLSYLGEYRIIRGTFYLIYELVLDTAGILFILGIILAFCRRAIIKPDFIHSTISDYLVLFLLVFIGITGFVVEALRLELVPKGYSNYSYIGNFIESVFVDVTDRKTGILLYQVLWFGHMLSAMIFVAAIPFVKLKHLFQIPANFLIHPQTSKSNKAKLDLPFNILEIDENSEGDDDLLETIGVGAITDFKWEDLYSIDSCINCGRCEEVCPAVQSGRELSPRNVISKISYEIKHKNKNGNFFDGIIKKDEMWECLNCYACVEVCPAFLTHVDYFLNMRRFIVNNQFEDEEKINIIGNLDSNGNPYGLPSYSRADWQNDIKINKCDDVDSFEYLYFVGCSSSYDQRCQNISKSIIEILEAADVQYAVLSEDERCCGEPAKRIGEEGLFQMIALENIELFSKYNVKKILVHCPHCYNMLKHEYKDFNGNYEVLHHTELISDLIKTKKIKFNGKYNKEKMTFHDPCNLGRLNGIYDEPRFILNNLGSINEMKKHRELSFCCGGGGGNSFYKVNEKTRPSIERLEQAKNTKADVLGVACPFCMTMFEDAKGSTSSESIVIKDIAEIVLSKMKNRNTE